MPLSPKVFPRFFKVALINQNHLNHCSAYHVYNFDLGLTPKEEALLTEIRKRKSELLDEIQVLSCIT